MFVHHVVSYLGAWEKFALPHRSELSEILEATATYYSGGIKLSARDEKLYGSRSRLHWERGILNLHWTLQDKILHTPAGRRLNMSSLGPTKNGVSVQLNFGNPSWFHRWLFSQGALAVRYGYVKIPILIAPMKEFERRDEGRERRLGPLSDFEYVKDQLETLAPLSANFPFLILGYSDNQPLLDVEVFELPSDPNITTERIVIDRCIEFPPEYHQAGLGILNYFGVFLRENYPDRDAKVRIEQHGMSVRLSVETEDGNVEVIEKALKDYELIVSGKVRPESITTSEMALLDLKNELRIAQFRLESQRDIIDVQNRQIDKFMDAIGFSLQAAASRPIAIQVNPTFHNSNSVTVNPDISEALIKLSELLEALPVTDENHMVLTDLSGSLEALECESNPEKLKTAAGITKLGKFLRKFAEGNETVTKAIANIEKGQQVVGDLGRTYNKIATLCGLPNIPFV
jgi:hypothetical protein